jgi:E3 ubiquitin-protein ligase TRIP12
LSAVLNYFDFFSTNVQRIAVNAAANCCKNISPDSYKMIKDVFPTLRQTLTMSDQRLVESSTLAVVRTLESYRHNASHLEGLLDLDTAIAINSLLMPSGGSPLLSPSTYTDLLRALTSSARGSAKVTINCLEAGMTSTIYQILTGVLPPSQDEDEQGMSAGGQGLAGGVADMAVLQNLAHRPKDQVEEALALIVELLPPTPKDGVFDSKAYSEKALGRLQKGKKAGKEKAPRRSSRTAAAEGEGSVTPPSDTATPGEASTSTSIMETTADRARFIGMMPYLPPNLRDPAAAKEAVQKLKRDSERRLELLKEHPDLVARFVKAMVPVLVDVYAASVAVRVRTKVLTGLVKAVAFTDAESLKATLRVCHPLLFWEWS